MQWNELSPKAIAERGEEIYRDRYQDRLERTQRGRFVAIDINTGEATVADRPEEAMHGAEEKDPDGLFHLIRVGYKAAYTIGWAANCAD